MKAVLLTGYGGPDKLVYREDVTKPTPSATEVLIKVGACGVNNTDLWTRSGAYGDENDPSGWKPLQFPRIQGIDIQGTIVEVGQKISTDRVGERVIVNPTVFSDPNDPYKFDSIGSERDGGFAEYVCVPAENAFAIESDYSDAELATFPCAYITAEHMLNHARVSQQDTVLVTGASGGVGSALVQLAKNVRKAKVVAIVGRGKESHLYELGADTVITRQDLSSQEIERVSVVADVVGGPLFETVFNLLEDGGRYVVAGAIAGPYVQLDLRKLYLRQVTMLGATLGTHAEFADLVSYIEAGLIKPLLAQEFALKNIRQAQEVFEQKQYFGKLVLVP